MIDYDTFFPLLLQRVPEFQHTFDEDIALFGDIINHAFMADLYDFVLQLYSKHLSHADDKKSLDVVTRALGYLEEAMASHDQRVPELVSLSFLEGLPPGNEIPRLSQLPGAATQG